MCMERKISKYTLFLLIALLITVVVRHFFDPLQLPTETYTLWDIKGNTVIEADIEPAYTMLYGSAMMAIIQFLCPVVSEMFECLKYMYGIMDERTAVMISAEIMMAGYVVFTYFLEKFHGTWHEEEGKFTVCVDMLCLENIASYGLSLIFYFIRKILLNCNVPEYVLIIIMALLIIPCVWITICYIAYLFANVIVTLLIPLTLGEYLSSKIPYNMTLIITGILILFSTQIVWRMCSDKIFNFLIEWFSFHHLSLD